MFDLIFFYVTSLSFWVISHDIGEHILILSISLFEK